MDQLEARWDFMVLALAAANLPIGVRLRVALDVLEELASEAVAVAPRGSESRLHLQAVRIDEHGRAHADGKGDTTGVNELTWELVAGHFVRWEATASDAPADEVPKDVPELVAELLRELANGKGPDNATDLEARLILAAEGFVASHGAVQVAVEEWRAEVRPAKASAKSVPSDKKTRPLWRFLDAALGRRSNPEISEIPSAPAPPRVSEFDIKVTARLWRPQSEPRQEATEKETQDSPSVPDAASTAQTPSFPVPKALPAPPIPNARVVVGGSINQRLRTRARIARSALPPVPEVEVQLSDDVLPKRNAAPVALCVLAVIGMVVTLVSLPPRHRLEAKSWLAGYVTSHVAIAAQSAPAIDAASLPQGESTTPDSPARTAGSRQNRRGPLTAQTRPRDPSGHL